MRLKGRLDMSWRVKWLALVYIVGALESMQWLQTGLFSNVAPTKRKLIESKNKDNLICKFSGAKVTKPVGL